MWIAFNKWKLRKGIISQTFEDNNLAEFPLLWNDTKHSHHILLYVSKYTYQLLDHKRCTLRKYSVPNGVAEFVILHNSYNCALDVGVNILLNSS